MDKDLPDNVVPISMLRIKYGNPKKCTCANRKYVIDHVNKEVLCADCGVAFSPYDALVDIAQHYDRLNSQVQSLHEQKKQIANWKPHLLPLRELERVYRGGAMLPCCPHCHRGIEARELTSYVNKQMEMERRKFDKGEA